MVFKKKTEKQKSFVKLIFGKCATALSDMLDEFLKLYLVLIKS